MSDIINRIKSDLKQAMRDKQEEKVAVLRLLLTAFQHKEISLRQAGKAELTDEQAQDVINAEVKKRKDSLEAYRDGKREDLAAKEESALAILAEYLPEQISPEELEKLIKQAIADTKATEVKDFGRVMGKLMPSIKGRADASEVTRIIKELL